MGDLSGGGDAGVGASRSLHGGDFGTGRGEGGLDALPLIATAVAKLSDADADYCIFGLLKVVRRKQPNGLGWGPVATENLLMYDDIGMTQMLKLAWEALVFNMSSFFAALPSDLKEAAQKPKGR